MEILELNLRHFGMFTDYRLKLHPGINIISGDNETGKSTLHAFIRAMFYGISRNRSRALDEYQLRQPWDNPTYFAGSLKLLYEGKIYRIDRNFYKKEESLSVVCETDGTQAQDPDAALAAFTSGLGAEDFDNTLFIRQAGSQTASSLGARIRDFLVNTEQSGTPDVDVTAAIEYLKKKKKENESEKASKLSEINELINRTSQEKEYVHSSIERLTQRASQTDGADAAGAQFQRVTREQQAVSGSDGDRQAGPEGPQPQNIQKGGLDTSFGRSGAGEELSQGVSPQGTRPQASYAGENVSYEASGDQDAADDRSGALMPVIVLLSFAAALLSAACAFTSSDLKIRCVFAAAAGIFAVIGAFMLYRFLHPQTRAQRAEKKAGREAFLDRHFGFRYDPDDPEDVSEQLRLERRRKSDIERARQLDLQDERAQSVSTAVQDHAGIQDAARPGMPEGVTSKQDPAAADRKSPRDEDRTDQQRTDRELELQMEREAGISQEMAREMSALRQKEAECAKKLEELYSQKAAIRSYDRETEAIELASSRISSLSGKIYHESGRHFQEDISTLLSGLTEGRYSSISLDEHMQVKINTPDRLLDISQVSMGTMQQIYLALRLSAADLLTGSADVPVVLDEAFAMYDDERLESALRFLSGCGRQVILFTCQRRELEVLSKIRG